MMQLSPDNRIIINVPNTFTKYLHIIQNPNNRGIACNLEQRAITLPTFNPFTLPSFPNFRLYDAEGSICDSLGIDMPVSASYNVMRPYLKIYPNPASDIIQIEISSDWEDKNNILLKVFDLTECEL